jgi:hypothetical protein
MIDISSLSLHIPTLLNSRNEREVVRDNYVDLSLVAGIIAGYVSLPLLDDPYVHSATVLRIALLDDYYSQFREHPFEVRIAQLVVTAILEGETWKFGDVNTPDERLDELFAPQLVDELRAQLSMTPVIVTTDALGNEIHVPDLFALKFLARPLGTIAETTKEVEAREERRLFFPNDETIHFSYIKEDEVEGDTYEITDYDNWASRTSFPWDEYTGEEVE